MKLIHCADLHLDSPMESNLPAAKARERRNEILVTFSDLIERADRNGASAVLIAGDLFDSDRTTRKTEQYVMDLIASHPNLYFFYLSGNHDAGSRFAAEDIRPQNLLTFGEDWTKYDFGDVFIAGSEHPDPETLDLPEDRLNIVMLHGQKRERGTAEGDIIPFQKYKNRNIDYMALGHLHSYQEAALDSRGVACYAGCLEGRGFDECGQKGYVLLETERNTIRHSFVPLARRQLHEVECSVTACTSQLEVENRIAQATAQIPQKDLVKAVLTGSRPAELLLDLPRAEQMLSERFYFAKLSDKTSLLIRPEDYSRDVSLKGELVRRVMASGLNRAEQERVIACGFRALAGEELDL